MIPTEKSWFFFIFLNFFYFADKFRQTFHFESDIFITNYQNLPENITISHKKTLILFKYVVIYI